MYKKIVNSVSLCVYFIPASYCVACLGAELKVIDRRVRDATSTRRQRMHKYHALQLYALVLLYASISR